MCPAYINPFVSVEFPGAVKDCQCHDLLKDYLELN